MTGKPGIMCEYFKMDSADNPVNPNGKFEKQFKDPVTVKHDTQQEFEILVLL